MDNQNTPLSLRVDSDLMVNNYMHSFLFSFAVLIQLSLPLFTQLILDHQNTTEGPRIILRQESRN
ncbi:hypothetical protein BT93_B0925 [Corymbia citriodora subsp. variegata]|nr:hypothetical protein BT93_B0925 [Corymbia citriodora subsp. variegata]